MKQLKIVVIFTGEARYLDVLTEWWKDYSDASNHNFIFINSTWENTDRLISNKESDRGQRIARILGENSNSAGSIADFLLTSHSTTLPSDNIFKKEKTPAFITEICEAGSGWDYSFGRTMQFATALEQFKDTIKQCDYVIHTRWDSILDNFEFEWDHVFEKSYNNNTWLTKWIGVIEGNFYIDDVILGSTVERVYECYPSTEYTWEKIVKIFEDMYKFFGPEYYDKPNLIYNHIIGHNQFLRYLMFHEQTVLPPNPVIVGSALFRKQHGQIPYRHTKEYFTEIFTNALPSDFYRGTS